jgi:redox-sensitive bicupin YhaK (pirin superfamily)
MAVKPVIHVINAMKTSDGAGVSLYRSLGQSQFARLDPFLMLDEFGTENPDDYIAGFPSHPHRGFETVTYMLEGHMLHEDHLGNRGDLRSGDVQWMTAGRGIIHSEMPQQSQGAMRGFQLWINLPASEKMKPASYKDISAQDIPVFKGDDGVNVKVIAGSLSIADQLVSGPVQGISTKPIYWDIHLSAGAQFNYSMSDEFNIFLYIYEGDVEVGEQEGVKRFASKQAVVLGKGEFVKIKAVSQAKVLLLAAIPLKEPVVQYGPFVMNTREEIEQAISDYQNNELV